MHDFDQRLFLLLNFDGGPVWDRVMLAVSGTTMWIPLYALILWLVWRRAGWRGTLTFLVLMAAAVGLADITAGIFKHNGLLGDLLPGLEPRWRPMFTPSLEGLDIPSDSLAAIRRASLPGDWAGHVPPGAVAGRYGTVSAHASTIVALALLSAAVIRRRWFTILVTLCALLICYSRIYLAKHFPMDILWGALLGAALGGVAYWIYHRLTTRKKKEAK